MNEFSPPPGARTNIWAEKPTIRAVGPHLVVDVPHYWNHITIVNQRLDRRHMGNESLTLSQLEDRIVEQKKILEENFPHNAERLPSNLEFIAMALGRAEKIRINLVEIQGTDSEVAASIGARKGQEIIELRAAREEKLRAASSDGLTVAIREVVRLLKGEPTKASRPFRRFEA